MQLDVEVSPSANIMTFWLALTHVTFDPDPCDLDLELHAHTKFHDPM